MKNPVRFVRDVFGPEDWPHRLLLAVAVFIWFVVNAALTVGLMSIIAFAFRFLVGLDVKAALVVASFTIIFAFFLHTTAPDEWKDK